MSGRLEAERALQPPGEPDKDLAGSSIPPGRSRAPITMPCLPINPLRVTSPTPGANVPPWTDEGWRGSRPSPMRAASGPAG